MTPAAPAATRGAAAAAAVAPVVSTSSTRSTWAPRTRRAWRVAANAPSRFTARAARPRLAWGTVGRRRHRAEGKIGR